MLTPKGPLIFEKNYTTKISGYRPAEIVSIYFDVGI